MAATSLTIASLFGLPGCQRIRRSSIDGSDPGTGSDDEVEALLDLEVASAVAPGANLTLYTAQDTTFQSGLNLAIQRALDDNAVNILNVSFGGCEAYQGQSGQPGDPQLLAAGGRAGHLRYRLHRRQRLGGLRQLPIRRPRLRRDCRSTDSPPRPTTSLSAERISTRTPSNDSHVLEHDELHHRRIRAEVPSRKFPGTTRPPPSARSAEIRRSRI